MAWFLNQQIGNVVKANKEIDPDGEVNWIDVEGDGWIDVDGKWHITPPYIVFVDIENRWTDLEGDFRK